METEQYRDFAEINHAVRQDAHTPLGRIVVSGMINNSPGTSRHPMRVFGSYALVYLLEGSGLYQDGNGYTHAVRPGDVLILFPELPHSYGPNAGEYWNELYIVFDGPAFDLWRRVGLLDPAQPVRHLEPIADWFPRLQEVVLAVWYAAPVKRIVEFGRFLALLTELLTADVPRPVEPPVQQWLAYVCFLLEADLNADSNLMEVARRAGMSYEGFRKRFQKLTGFSPARYRTNRRMEVACSLLQHTSMTNRQVAESVGFPDEYYFYKRFKQIVGKTPRAYRLHQP
jgi:AraC-like DNA-binding protein